MVTTKISIVIPVYNVRDYLSECVDSVINQSLRDIEIILVDDGSTDGSGAMCDDYAKADSRVRVIHKENGGLSSARNAGLRVAAGEYIYFLDSDDYIETNAMDELYAVAKKNDLDMVMFTARTFVDGVIRSCYAMGNYQVYKHHVNEALSGIECLRLSIQSGEYIASTCMRFYRASLFDGGRRISYCEGIIHEDEDVGVLTLLNSRRVMKLDIPFYNRRYRPGSIMTALNRVASAKGYMHAACRMIQEYDASDSQEVRTLLINRFENFLNADLRLYCEADHRERRSIFRLIRDADREYRLGRYPLTRKKYRLCLKNPAIAIPFQRKEWRERLKYYEEKDPAIHSKFRHMMLDPRRKIILLGSPVHGNLGDHLIALSEMDYFRNHMKNRPAIDCIMPFALNCMDIIQRSVKPRDVICLSGGGWLGTKWRHNEEFVRRVIALFPDNPIVILPQMVYYENEPEYSAEGAGLYAAHRQLLFCVREQASYDYVTKHGFADRAHTLLMPDFALLYHGYQAKPQADREGIMICLRDDVERCMDDDLERHIRDEAEKIAPTTDIRTNISPTRVSTGQRLERVTEKLDEIGKCRLLVTDRLHAMLFAAISGTPCLAFDNATHKVKGVYEWVKPLRHIQMANEDETLGAQLSRLYNMKPEQTLDSLGLAKYEGLLEQRIQELTQER